MMSFKFFILLSFQLSAISSAQNDHNINGISMTLHTKRKMKSESTMEITVEEPLHYPSDFIEYYIKLSVGTPAQDLLLVMDTGSNVVWAPCTRNYTCHKCHGYSTVFFPSKSSSAVPVKCADPKCKDLAGEESYFDNCSGACPGYLLQYGTGITTGHLLTETLTLPLEGRGRREVKKFGVGCSVASSWFSGIAGFGRGSLSMPSQLSPLFGDRFAYCLDNLNNSSKIVLGDMALLKGISLTYIPFLNKWEAPSFRWLRDYYYLPLEGVSIGGKRLMLPSNLLAFDDQGNGGTIIDSGTSYTYFPEAMYKQIVSEFASQIGYRRLHVQGLCYNVSGVRITNIQLPRFVFHFKGGSAMVLPNENSFTADGYNILKGSSDKICLAIYNGGSVPGGPAVVLGNFQQNNFYLFYDRQYNRLGFAHQSCKAFG